MSLANMQNSIGLWSSLGAGYRKHFELIQDAFPYQCLNDHTHDGEHLAILLPRKELKIPDKEWLQYRNNCWLQREWSSSITPKGAFFCEVAASQAMLFGGTGWTVEKDWWKREPEDFKEQLKYCENCSICLPVPKNRASSQIGTVSPKMFKKLKSLGSPKVAKGLTSIFDVTTYNPEKYKINYTCEPYLPAEGNLARVAETNASIKIKEIVAVLVCVGYDDYLDLTLPYTKQAVDRLLVVTDKNDKKTKALCEKHGVPCHISKRIHEGGAVFAKGKAINDGLEILKPKDWVLTLDADIILSPAFRDSINKYVLNPGVLYFTRRWGAKEIGHIPPFINALHAGESWASLYEKYGNKTMARVEGRIGNDQEHLPFGYFQLFNVNAKSLHGRKRIYCENSKTAEHDDKDFGFEVFPQKRRASLPIPLFDVIHIPHGFYQENWEGRRSPRLESVFQEPLRYIPQSKKFRCVTECFFAGKIYKPGEIYRGADANKHFTRDT